MKVDRRKLVGGLLVAVGLALFIVPFLSSPPSQPAGTTPSPTIGNNHGGSNGRGGSSTPACTTNCQSSTDTQPPTTTIQMTGPLNWPRNNITYFYPNIMVTLVAIDDQSLTSITLDDNATTTSFTAQGRSATVTLTLTTQGLHMLTYYSTDKASNKEKPLHATVGLSKPTLSDIRGVIMNSGINNAGTKNALLAKISTVQAEIVAGQKPDALDSLSNQLKALDGKHGLDQATVDLVDAMIQTIT